LTEWAQVTAQTTFQYNTLYLIAGLVMLLLVFSWCAVLLDDIMNSQDEQDDEMSSLAAAEAASYIPCAAFYDLELLKVNVVLKLMLAIEV